MMELIQLQVTIFSLILCGVILKKIGLIGEEGQKNITDLVIYVVLPCNIFQSFLGDFSDSVWRQCAQILAISLGIQLAAIFYGRFVARGQSAVRRKSLTYGIISSNAGFLGNPIAEGLYGAMGLMLASIYLIPQRIMMWSEGIAIYSGVKDFKSVTKRVLTHPCVISCAIGIVFMARNLKLPEIVLSPIETLGKCNTALSMLVIGLILADLDWKKLFDKAVLRFTVHRLLIIPAIVWGACRLFSVSDLAMDVSVILSAMPAAATTSILAAKYDQDPEFAVTLVVFSTLCSIPTIFLWSVLLRMG